jgi:hypothetical protein
MAVNSIGTPLETNELFCDSNFLYCLINTRYFLSLTTLPLSHASWLDELMTLDVDTKVHQNMSTNSISPYLQRYRVNIGED